jgi:hypothetical protein
MKLYYIFRVEGLFSIVSLVMKSDAEDAQDSLWKLYYTNGLDTDFGDMFQAQMTTLIEKGSRVGDTSILPIPWIEDSWLIDTGKTQPNIVFVSISLDALLMTFFKWFGETFTK